ncbi:MAG: asparagine synthase (glutamine-hydrolyzing) [Alphaproteobacteria bacterium]|nr:asparagine synthase (glutamine-hydrolyzing) [Alphaproteobacteria bacterium]
MCGIAGYWDRRAATDGDTLAALARGAGDAMAHRGPDGDGVWVDADAGLALAHRRLAIVDLSPTGAQPMTSSCGRYVISYNGEVFNFLELRRELEAAGQRFRGTSDTEVMLEGFVRWGVEATVKRLIGMFAFALWDRTARRLWLVRDRLGIKPLYYLANDSVVLFGSELKALRALPGWTPKLDRASLAQYLRRGYVPHPLSIYESVRKLPPGHILELSADAAPRLSAYWSLREVATNGIAAARSDRRSPDDAVRQLEALLRDAIRRRMIADVPLGAFLSGGVDSSLVVALMQSESNRPVKTFSIGFREGAYNEAGHARAVAAHLGTEHQDLVVEPRHALDLIPRLPKIYDEPFADSSQIPTYLVAEMTRRHVTVALSGDGGDELFAGYHRYGWGEWVWDRVDWMPRPLRSAASALFGAAQSVLPASLPAARRMGQAGRLLDCRDIDGLYDWLTQPWPRDTVLMAPPATVSSASEPCVGLNGTAVDTVTALQFRDMADYLPEDILTKLDRATMAVSLEGRVPLLDHRVVEHAWTLPMSLKRRDGAGKWILREVLARHVPRDMTDRPKQGFEVPIGDWLRTELRDWADELMAPQVLGDMGLNAEPIRQAWLNHMSGKQNNDNALWVILMATSWWQEAGRP